MNMTMKTNSLLPHGGSSVSTQPISNQKFEVFGDDNNGDTSVLDGSCRGEGSLLTDWAIVVSPDDEEHLRPHQSEPCFRQPEELEQDDMRPSSTNETKLFATVRPKLKQTHTKQDSIGQLLNRRLEDLVIEDLFLEELLKKSEAKALLTKENTRSDNLSRKAEQNKDHSDSMNKNVLLSSTTESARNEKTNTSPDDDEISTIISSLTSRKKTKSRTIQRLVSSSESTVLRMSSQPIVLASFPSGGY